MTRFGLILTLLASQIAPAIAQADIYDEAEITVTRYPVTGASLAEVQDQMNADGPQGFWAHTSWKVVWTADCETTVTAEIILPELQDDADLTEDEAAEFDRMSAALLDHELGHVRIGVDYAEAASDAACPTDTHALDADFAARELNYDAETDHGRTQGAYLELP
jgi:predicted secreted Zn-dependent protease